MASSSSSGGQVVVLERRRVARGGGDDCGTYVAGVQGWARRGTVESAGAWFRAAFVAHYGVLRAQAAAFGRPGVAVLAVDRMGGLAGLGLVAARRTGVSSLVIGRHSRADVQLVGDPGLSLRHVAVLLAPIGERRDGAVRFRVIDLRTEGGMVAESGETIASFSAEGPAFVRCGAHLLMFLGTGGASAWLRDAESAWAALPARLVRVGEGALGRPRVVVAARDADRDPDALGASVIRSFAAPVELAQSTAPAGEPWLGVLDVRSARGGARIPVGAAALERGLLLGRYGRCAASAALDHESISRVHALLVRVGGRVAIVDMASTNGICAASGEGERKRVVHVDAGEHVVLGLDAVVRWRARQPL